jgi:hypothetical protein
MHLLNLNIHTYLHTNKSYVRGLYLLTNLISKAVGCKTSKIFTRFIGYLLSKLLSLLVGTSVSLVTQLIGLISYYYISEKVKERSEIISFAF